MRYILFGDTDFYYAKGGAHDLMGSSNDIEILKADDRLKEDCASGGICWWHILDTETNCIVCGSELQAYGAPDLKRNQIIKDKDDI